MNSFSNRGLLVMPVFVAAGLVTACAEKTETNYAAASADLNVAQASTEPAHLNESSQSAQRSNSAVLVLTSAAAARNAISGKDMNAAMVHVDAALAELGKTGDAGLIPIYSELAQTSFLGPLEQASESKASSAPKQPKGPAVAAVTASYSRVLLDRSVTQTQLREARHALARGDLAEADKHLATVQRGVVLERSAMRVPLVKARENLTLASAAASRSDWREVKAQLTAAANALNAYGNMAPAAEVADVRLLSRQIGQLESGLPEQQAKASSLINQWWVKVANLSDKAP